MGKKKGPVKGRLLLDKIYELDDEESSAYWKQVQEEERSAAWKRIYAKLDIPDAEALDRLCAADVPPEVDATIREELSLAEERWLLRYAARYQYLLSPRMRKILARDMELAGLIPPQTIVAGASSTAAARMN